MRFAGGQEPDDQRFSSLDLYGDFFSRSQAIKKGISRKNTHIPVGLPELVIFGEHLGIQQVA